MFILTLVWWQHEMHFPYSLNLKHRRMMIVLKLMIQANVCDVWCPYWNGLRFIMTGFIWARNPTNKQMLSNLKNIKICKNALTWRKCVSKQFIRKPSILRQAHCNIFVSVHWVRRGVMQYYLERRYFAWKMIILMWKDLPHALASRNPRTTTFHVISGML